MALCVNTATHSHFNINVSLIKLKLGLGTLIKYPLFYFHFNVPEEPQLSNLTGLNDTRSEHSVHENKSAGAPIKIKK